VEVRSLPNVIRSLLAVSVFLSDQAGSAFQSPSLFGLSGSFQLRAGPSMQAIQASLAALFGGRVAFLGGLQAVHGGLSLNRIFCWKDSLLPILRKSPKYET